MKTVTVKLIVRIARELHLPISTVMEMPAHEINWWSAVYFDEWVEYLKNNPEEQEDYLAKHPEDADLFDVKTSISTAMNYLGEGTVRHRKKGERAKLSGKIKE